jgi:hypothetical protein
MNSMRWMIVALALAGAPACKKEKAVDPAAAATPAPTEASKTADPGAEADRAATDPAAADPAAVDPAAADPAGQPEPGSKDMVAVSSAGTAKVIATGKKTIADSESYTVKLAAPDKLATGAKGSATLEVAPKKGWHLNDEFPYKLTVTAPAGTKVAKPEQGKKDTVAFSREAMKWSIDFEASSAGNKAFTGKVKFAVCTETSCEPKKEELAFNVVVE